MNQLLLEPGRFVSRRLALAICAFLLCFLQAGAAQAGPREVDRIANQYVTLVFQYSAHDGQYVDPKAAPPALVAAARANPRSLEQLAAESRRLLTLLVAEGSERRVKSRARFLKGQLQALSARIASRQGRKMSFVEEAEAYFGVKLNLRPLSAYDPLIAEVARLIPGDAPLADRVLAFRKKYEIPPARLGAVMEKAVAACREKTVRHFALPAGESVTIGYVTGKPWSGIAFYEGKKRTKIEINSELPDSFAHVMTLACHEAYPGHHVQSLFREMALSRPGAPVELSIYPAFSPMNLIGEGAATFGKDLAFPREEQIHFNEQVLAPLAGVNPAGMRALQRLEEITQELFLAQVNIGAELIDGRIDRPTAERLLQRYGLLDPARATRAAAFLVDYRTFILNYSVGTRLVDDYVRRTTRNEAQRWRALRALNTGTFTTADLIDPRRAGEAIPVP